MTRRRNPPPRRPLRPTKDKDQLDSELRMARANRKSDSLQKQKLRRLEWDEDAENPGEDDLEEAPLFGEPTDEAQDEEEEEDESGRG